MVTIAVVATATVGALEDVINAVEEDATGAIEDAVGAMEDAIGAIKEDAIGVIKDAVGTMDEDGAGAMEADNTAAMKYCIIFLENEKKNFFMSPGAHGARWVILPIQYL